MVCATATTYDVKIDTLKRFTCIYKNIPAIWYCINCLLEGTRMVCSPKHSV